MTAAGNDQAPGTGRHGGGPGGGPSGGKGAQRRAGRVLALQLLYAYEQKGYRDDEALTVEDDCDTGNADTVTFARSLLTGFVANRAPVDAAVDSRLQNWRLGRLAVIDRTLLRLGCYELLYCADTPAKVAINEYIELAKQYGSEANSTKLINGVLDKIARDHRSADAGLKPRPVTDKITKPADPPAAG